MLHHIDLGSNTAQCQNVNYETQINFLSASRNVHPDHTREKIMKKIMGMFL